MSYYKTSNPSNTCITATLLSVPAAYYNHPTIIELPVQITMSIDPRSGFDTSTSTFHSKRPPISLAQNPILDLTTFISSRPHNGTIAFIDAITDRHITFTEVWCAVDSLSSSLSSMGIRKGHVVLILSPNSIYFPIVCLSVMSLGAIITTTNPLNTKSEITKQLKDSKPVLAFTLPELIPKIADLSIPIILLTETSNQNCHPTVKILTTIEKLMCNEPTQIRAKDRITQDDTAAILYSSGTTGASKGVVMTHKNLMAMVQTAIDRFKLPGSKQHTFIGTIPMFHIYGLGAFATGLLAIGATVVILPKFEIHDLLSAIAKYKVTYFPLVPPIIVGMINNAEEIKRKYDLGSLVNVLSGGAPLGKDVIEGFVEKFRGVGVLQGYGLTETTGIAASSDKTEESMRYGTAGLLSQNMEAKVVEVESGGVVGVGKIGEIWLKGPTVMKGYLNNPEETAATIDSNGWLRTGDIGYFDEDGFLFIVDRLKELIKYKAFQVAPAELEAVLLTHPDVEDAAVIPFPDKEVGQYPMAYVVRKSCSCLSDNQIMDFVAKQVAPYKRIRRVAFICSIPKNASGKILRKDLIQLATTSKL